MEAKRDQNRITTLIAASSVDGIIPRLVYADPTSHALKTNDGNTGSDYGIVDAVRDENRIPVAMAVSSSDGITPVELYSSPLYNLFIQSS